MFGQQSVVHAVHQAGHVGCHVVVGPRAVAVGRQDFGGADPFVKAAGVGPVGHGVVFVDEVEVLAVADGILAGFGGGEGDGRAGVVDGEDLGHGAAERMAGDAFGPCSAQPCDDEVGVAQKSGVPAGGLDG